MISVCDGCKKSGCTKKVSIFSTLNQDELRGIAIKLANELYKKGNTIFSEGDTGRTLYLVSEGKVKLYKYTSDGREQILHILSEGDFFGELNLLKESQYGFYAKAIEDCRLCTLGKEEFRDIIASNPKIGIKILEVMGDRLTRLESLAQNLATKDVDSRFAYLLTELADKYGIKEGTSTVISLTLSREDMASYIGVARETISRKLKKFQEEGLITLEGKRRIIINNRKLIEEYI
ncbi:MAG: Crp/Fnr family transcriptional regulator [Clostridium sp.]